MIVCDGLDAKGCPVGAVLDVELVGRDLRTTAAVGAAWKVLKPYGWVLAVRDSMRRGGGVAFDPLCKLCAVALAERLLRGPAGNSRLVEGKLERVAPTDELAAESQSILLQMAARGDA